MYISDIKFFKNNKRTFKFFLTRIFICLFLVLGIHSLTLSNESAPEHGSASGEGHGSAAGQSEGASEHGGGEAASKGGHEEAKPKVVAWAETEAKLAELTAKVSNKKATIEQLILEKNHLPPGSPHLKDIVDQIVKEHKSLKSLVEEYEKYRNILKYRFPERGSQEGRNYQKMEVKSVEELEKTIGVDGKLNRNMKKLKKIYKVKNFTTTTTTLPATDPLEQGIESKKPVILNK